MDIMNPVWPITALFAPGRAVVFGVGWLFGARIFAGWVLDFILAFAMGIVFQYFAIVPMRGLRLLRWRGA